MDELIELFEVFESEVEKHCFSLKNECLLTSNLIEVERGITQTSLTNYLLSVISQIEESQTFIKLNDNVKSLLGSQETNLEKQINVNPELLACIDESDYEGWGKPSIDIDEPFKNWLRLSGFYKQKIIEGDNLPWKSKFTLFLETEKKSNESFYLYLAIDELFYKINDNNIGDCKLINSEDIEFCKLEFVKNIDIYINYYEHYDITPSAILEDFRYLNKTIHNYDHDLHSNNRNEFIKENFWTESILLLLLTPWEISFPNYYIIPNIRDHQTFHNSYVKKRKSRLNYNTLMYFLDPPEIVNTYNEHTISIERYPNYKIAKDNLFSLLRIYENKLSIPLNWYFSANDSESKSESFILYVITLESLLVGEKTNETKEKFCARFSKILSSNAVNQRLLRKIGEDIYSVRCKMVHGSDEGLSEEPNNCYSKLFSDIKMNYSSDEFLRNLTRKVIIIALLTSDMLNDKSCSMYIYLDDNQLGLPKKWKSFIKKAFRTLGDDELFWTKYYEQLTIKSKLYTLNGESILFDDEI